MYFLNNKSSCLPDLPFISHLKHSRKCSTVAIVRTVFNQLIEGKFIGLWLNQPIDPTNFFSDIKFRSTLLCLQCGLD